MSSKYLDLLLNMDYYEISDKHYGTFFGTFQCVTYNLIDPFSLNLDCFSSCKGGEEIPGDVREQAPEQVEPGGQRSGYPVC